MDRLSTLTDLVQGLRIPHLQRAEQVAPEAIRYNTTAREVVRRPGPRYRCE